jgi:serine/threonine-protein kinase
MKSSARDISTLPKAKTRHYAFDGYRLDTHARLLVDAGGNPVPLTGKAFDTLCHLIEHRDRIVGKEELLAAVWPGRVVEENNLAQAVTALRRALGIRADDHRVIVTIPGRGYRFVASLGNDAIAIDGVPGISSPVGTVAQPTDPAIRTIAVLPFRPTLPDQRDEVLEWGMADTLATRLSNHRLAVRPLASVRGFEGADQDPVAAGRELAVDAVLEGTVQRLDHRLRVAAQLLRVRDGSTLWSGQFDEHDDRVLDDQDGMAREVAATLRLDAGEGHRQRPDRRHTANVSAYRLYLAGRYYVRKQTISDNRSAIALFQQAIDLDPTYALAYAGLAEAYRVLPINGDVDPNFAFPLAKAAAIRALEIDEHVAEARAGLAWVAFWFDWDWAAAEAHARRAIALNANDADAHYVQAHLLYCTGRHAEALEHGRRAREIDPLSPILGTLEVAFLFADGRDDEALRRLDETLAMAPGFWVAYLSLGGVLLQRGDHAAAIDAFTTARDLSGGSLHAVSALGYIWARNHERAKAQALLAELLARSEEHYLPATAIATILLGLDRPDEALAWLERAYAQRDVGLVFIRVRRTWDALRSDPRFERIAKRMGLDASAPAPVGSPVP